MKESAEVTILPYCWLAVCKAFFKRYPNPYSAHVLSEDTVHREIKDGKLLSKRIFSKTAKTSLPAWIGKIVKKPQVSHFREAIFQGFGARDGLVFILSLIRTRNCQVFILEDAIIDLCAKRLISLTRNLDHKKLVVTSETTEYTPSYFDPNKTVMTRRTTVRSPLNGLMGRMIERVCHIGAIRNAKTAVQVKRKKRAA